MEINIHELKSVVNSILDHIIVKRGIVEVKLEHNYFWDIPGELVYSVNSSPPLDIGSLEDNWGFLSLVLGGKSQPIAYQLTELAPILRAIGEKLANDLARHGG